jgi:hypothetical protein
MHALRLTRATMRHVRFAAQFAAVVRRVESLRGRAGESARQGEGLFQSLLDEAFRG